MPGEEELEAWKKCLSSSNCRNWRKGSDEEDKLGSLNRKEYYKDKNFEMSNNFSENGG